MGVLAEEYIQLRADTRTLGRELTREGAKAGRTFGTSFSGVLKGVLGAAAIWKAGASIVRFLSDANQEYRESAKVGKTTAAIIKSTGGAAKITAGQVSALTSALAVQDGVDDELVASGANLLLTFKNVRNEAGKGSDIFNRATAAAVDLSKAGFGSVSSGSKMLGKALNDPLKGLTALSRAGVTFTEGQKKQITQMVKAGDILGAQKLIMKEVESQVGGVAAAQADWADKAKAAFGEVKETVGGFLSKGLEPISKWFVEKGLPAIQDFFDKLSKNKELKAAISDLKTALQDLTGQDFKAALDGIATSLPPVVEGLATVITKYKEFATLVDQFENQSFAEGDKVGGPVGQIVKDFGPGGTIDQAIIHFRTQVVAWVKQAWAGAKASFLENHGAILADVKGFWARLKDIWAAAAAWVSATASAWWSRIKTTWAAAQTWIRETWGTFWGKVKTTASTAINLVRTTISDVMTKIRDRFKSGVDAIGRAWDVLKDKAKKPVQFVVWQVLNGGLIRAFNTVSKKVGGPQIPAIHLSGEMAHARGTSQVLPGYTPGRDVHRFYSATGGVLDLSGGEGIARPELVAAVGRKRWDAANRAARIGDVDKGLRYLGGFAQGSSGIQAAINYAHSIGIRNVTTYGGHHPSRALARDFMTSNRSTGDKMANWLWANRKAIHLWYEIYYRRIRSMTREGAGWTRYSGSNPHTDHVHAAWYSSGAAGALTNAIGSGAFAVIDYVKQLKDKFKGPLDKLKKIGNSAWAQMLKGAVGKLKDAMIAKIKSAMASMATAVGTGFTSVSGGSNRAIGHRMMLQRWPESQWPALNSLWTRESGWRTTAKNPSSGAYGIPQALPASKMASAGSDWRTNPATQIKWGLGYIASRYGSPSAAWAHSQRTGWYDQGGLLKPGLTMALNTTGRDELVTPIPRGVSTRTAAHREPPRPIKIQLDLGEDLRYYIQGVIDDNDEFKAGIGRLS